MKRNSERSKGSRMRIGFCGLGLMGSRMARRLLMDGHEVMVWNRSIQKTEALQKEGAQVATTPAEVSAHCEIVFSCVYDAAAVHELVFGVEGLGKAKGKMKVFVDHASIPPKLTQEYALRLKAETGVSWVDAPVSGGTGGAEKGTLAIMAGGEAADIEAIRPYVASYAQRLTHMGKNGAGQTTKLCNQAIVASTIAVIAEAMRLAEDEGVDASLLSDALAGGWADSVLLQLFVPRMSASDEVPVTATLATMLKDLDTVAQLAQTNTTAMPISHATQQLYRMAAKRGLAQQDASQIIKALS